MLKILFVGGGSIGHIAPCIAVWEAVKERKKDVAAHFVCSDRSADIAYLQKNHVAFSTIPLVRRSWRVPFTCIKAYRKAKRILQTVQPSVIFSKGSSVSVPVCFAGRRLGIPIVMHESDAVPGFASRFTARFAKVVLTGFPGTGLRTAYVSGNPVRASILRGNRSRGLKRSGLSGDRPILLVLGGSQGSRALNEAILGVLDALLEHCDIIHITGKGKESAGVSRPGYFQMPFAEEGLEDFYACAAVALSRSGAGILSELFAWGIPTLVVPLEGVAQNHQYANAKFFAERGACVLLDQRDLEQSFLPEIRKILNDPMQRENMQTKARALGSRSAAAGIAEKILGDF